MKGHRDLRSGKSVQGWMDFGQILTRKKGIWIISSWIGSKEGDRLLFETEASCIAVQYRKTIRHPARKAELILDGDTKHPVLLDGNFDEDWGDCLYLEPVLHHGEYGKHTVEIRVLPEPLYLMALIIA